MIITVAKERNEGCPLASRLMVSIDLSNLADADCIIENIMRKLNERVSKDDIRLYADAETLDDKTAVHVDDFLIIDVIEAMKDMTFSLMGFLPIVKTLLKGIDMRMQYIFNSAKERKASAQRPAESANQ